MLHVWLVPALAVLAATLCGFYLLIKYRGGGGVRTEGKIMVHKPAAEDDPPPG